MARLRRRSHERRGLTAAERDYLMTGLTAADAFSWRDHDGIWQTDELQARIAWHEHRDELLAEAAEHGLVPWAGRHFEGMVGRVSPYEHLAQPPARSN